MVQFIVSLRENTLFQYNIPTLLPTLIIRAIIAPIPGSYMAIYFDEALAPTLATPAAPAPPAPVGF